MAKEITGAHHPTFERGYVDLSSCGTPEARHDREVFFRSIFGSHTGFICIGISPAPQPGAKRKMHQRFFEYPTEMSAMMDLIAGQITRSDIYFCPQFLSKKELVKATVNLCPVAWADLDSCAPHRLLVEPTIVWESSPGHYQSVWRFEEPLQPLDAEDISRRVAYYHADMGADRSGWDLTQFLRVPLTANYKLEYSDALSTLAEPPVVHIVGGSATRYRVEDFKQYPVVERPEFLDMPFPEELPTEDPLEIIQKYRRSISPIVFDLYSNEPEGSWSEPLWRLMMLLFESGMTTAEVVYITNLSACNKYRRDGRDISYLWRDVCRAYVRFQQNVRAAIIPAVKQVEIITDEELRQVSSHETFVDRYITWASSLGDAAIQYHQAGGFIVLSAILAGRVRLPTSYGLLVPNLWFMILGDTTLTRKSTAMDIAMDLVEEVDEDALLATDGSLEGLMHALQTRPGRASIFLRDEFSGLLEMMTKRDYYAGMIEMLTKLYDGKMQKRILRREVVEVREPVLIVFAGGIRNRVQSLLTTEHVSSGFIPRFVFVTAESDADRIRPLGPPTVQETAGRDLLIQELNDLIAHYHIMEGRLQTKKWDAHLSTDAWARYNLLESTMLQAGLDSERPELMTPVFDRLAKSTLKSAILIAASRQTDDRITVDESDIVSAIRYCNEWRNYAIEVVNGMGRSSIERELDKVFRAIQRAPGIARSKLMQNYHLTSKAADVVFDTLMQRGLVTPNRVGQMVTYWPLVPAKPDLGTKLGKRKARD